jgi:hypothetical protein
MKVIAHQATGMDLPTGIGARLSQAPRHHEDHLETVAAIHHGGTTSSNSIRRRRAIATVILTRTGRHCQCSKLTLSLWGAGRGRCQWWFLRIFFGKLFEIGEKIVRREIFRYEQNPRALGLALRPKLGALGSNRN